MCGTNSPHVSWPTNPSRPQHVIDKSNRPTKHLRKIRAGYPNVVSFAVLFLMLVTPAAAFDEPHALSPATAAAGYHHGSRLPIGLFFTLLVLIGQTVASFSSTLVGPMMGITSVLWLMMRNDSAISPKVSWM
ncbi:hypothetical protein CUC08_Gglean011649 [Alternaria sp. MG1]|nr:hypothetical protein CUC08_Gglean011649 [Alternaria sp. MG1]